MQDINTLCRVNSSLLYSGLIEQFGHPNNFKNTIYTNIKKLMKITIKQNKYIEKRKIKRIF